MKSTGFDSPPATMGYLSTIKQLNNMGQQKEQVNHPAHYQGEGGMETIEAMIGVFGKEAVAQWCKITAFKYICRMGKKDAYPQDAEKAAWYIRKSTELKHQTK